MRLVLIGDIHCFDRCVAPWRMFSKRFIGMSCLWFRRQFQFDMRLLTAVLERTAALEPDMLLLSGDLSTTSLPEEFAAVRRELDRAIGGVPTLIVPGNHDRYIAAAVRQRTMEQVLGERVPPMFPLLRPLGGRWRLLALDSARPSFFNACGRLGAEQLEAIRQQLEGLTGEDGLVVLCHYPASMPPHVRDGPGHALVDRAALLRILGLCPARQVYLHGHVHEPWLWQPEQQRHWRMISINAGSPTFVSARHPLGQGFWEIVLPDDPRQPLRASRHIPASPAVFNGPQTASAGQPSADSRWRIERVL